MKKNNGFSLLEVLVGTSLIGLVSLGAGNLVVNWSQSNSRQNLASVLSQVRLNVENSVNSDTAWAKTISGNPPSSNLACLNNDTGCNGIADSTFQALDPNGNPVVFNASPGYTGFNVNGSLCTTNCPITLNLTWRPSCNTTVDPNCRLPLVTVTGTYTGSGVNSQTSLNWAKYNFTFQRRALNLSPCAGAPTCGANSICTSSGWQCPPIGCGPRTAVSWSVTTPVPATCIGDVPMTSANSNSAVVASTNGNIGTATFFCDVNGQWPAGNPIPPNAGATCAPPLCPAVAGQTWSIGAASCSADLPAAYVGYDSSPLVSVGPNLGGAIFHCNAGQTWSLNPGATCAAPAPVFCPTGPQSWTVGANTCSGNVNSAVVGSDSSPVTSTTPAGSATFHCNAGQTWSLNNGATCSATAPGSCPAAVLAWASGSNTCTANVGSSVVGSTLTATATNPNTGTAIATCGASLAYTITGSNCSPANPSPSPSPSACGQFFPKVTGPAFTYLGCGTFSMHLCTPHNTDLYCACTNNNQMFISAGNGNQVMNCP